MYYLIDELIVPTKYQSVFLKKLPYFRRLYRAVSGVTSVVYLKTILPRHKNSYLLIITFKTQHHFQNYHDNSDIARQIHLKISRHFGGKQLSIKLSLHGLDIPNQVSPSQ